MNNHWKRIATIRGLLFSGKNEGELFDLGFSAQEIKAAATLNQKYFIAKANEGGLNFILV